MEMSENLFLHLHVLDESPSKNFTKEENYRLLRSLSPPKRKHIRIQKSKSKKHHKWTRIKKKNHMDLRSFLINKTLKDTNRNKKSL